MTPAEIKKHQKTELHCHLGAMSSAHRLWELAHTQGIKLPVKNYFDFVDIITGTGDGKSISHSSYLLKFELTQMIQSSPLAVEQSVYNAIADAYISDNVTTIEVRFNPMLRNKMGYFDLDMIIGHACIGVQKARNIFPVNAGIIISTDRSFTKLESNVLAHKATRFADVVGFDMSGGTTKNFRLSDHYGAFAHAKEAGLGITIHAGEVLDDSIDSSILELRKVLSHIKPNRIGHGILSHHSQRIMETLVADGVHLEICPSSNLKTKCVDSVSHLGSILRTLQDNNVSFSLNTDGFVFLNTDISSQFSMVWEHLDNPMYILENAKHSSFVKSNQQ